MRHLDIRELWMQEYVRRKRAEVVRVPTETNVADIGTKPLPQARLEALLRMLPASRREGMSMKRGVAALSLLAMVTAGEPSGHAEDADARTESTETTGSAAGVVTRATTTGDITTPYHEIVTPEFAAVEMTRATTDTKSTMLYWTVLLYLFGLHAAAAYGCRAWWRSPRRTARHKADDSTDDSDGPAAGETLGAARVDDDKEVLELMRSFTVDELRCRYRERG